MTALLVDSSAILAAFDPDDPHQEDALTILADGALTLMTLDLARYEVTNVAVRAWRAPEVVGSLLAALERIEQDGGVVTSTGMFMSRAAEVAERHSISVYDAAYVAAADDGDRQLVSCDERDLVSNGLAVLPADARGLVASDDD